MKNAKAPQETMKIVEPKEYKPQKVNAIYDSTADNNLFCLG